jgi:hypothetical protein
MQKDKKNNKVNIKGLWDYVFQVVAEQGSDFKPSYLNLIVYFFHINNSNFWQDEFEFSRSDACNSVGIRSTNTFINGLHYLSEQVGLIKIISVPKSKYSKYNACFSTNIKQLFFNNFIKNPSDLDPKMAIGMEIKNDSTVSKNDMVKPDFNNLTVSKFDMMDFSPYQFLMSTVSKNDTVNENTPINNNKHKHNKEKQEKTATEGDKKIEIPQKKKKLLSEQFNNDPNSKFYKWPLIDIRKFNDLKNEFYNHEELIFNTQMRLQKLSKQEVLKWADEFWATIQGTSKWDQDFNGIRDYFHNWLNFKLKKHAKEQQQQARIDNNSNSTESRQARIKQGFDKIDRMFDDHQRNKHI